MAQLEARAREFLNRIVGGPAADQNLHEFLKDGTVLCNMFNKLVPGNQIKKINHSALPFKQIENISTYLTTCTTVGSIPQAAQFDTTDLFEDKGMLKVLQHLDYVQRHEAELNSIDPDKAKDSPKIVAPKGPAPNISMRKIPLRRPSLNESTGLSPMEPSVSSLESDIETKEEMKFNPELERMARTWIQNVLKNDPTAPPIVPNRPLVESIKSGVLLCKLVNEIVPGTVPKIHTSNIPYQHIENIRSYLTACKKIGLSSLSIFDVPDLHDCKNVSLVIQNIHSLAAHVRAKITDYKGPQMEEEDIAKTKSLFSSSLVEKELEFLVEGNEGDEPKEEGEKELVKWVNSQLSKGETKDKNGKPLKIKNLDTSLRSGIMLIELIKVLTQSTHVGSYTREPATLWDCMRNARQALKFLSYQTLEEVRGCSARDIVSGNVMSIILLLEYLREKFDVDFLFQQIVSNISIQTSDKPIKNIEEEKRIAEEKRQKELEAKRKHAEEQKKIAEQQKKKASEEKKNLEESKKKLEEQLEQMKLQKKKREEETLKKEEVAKKKLEQQEIKRKAEEESQKALEVKQKLLEQQRSEKENQEKLKEEARKLEEERESLKKQIQLREAADLKAKQEEEARNEEERKAAKKLKKEEKRIREERRKIKAEKKKLKERRREEEEAAAAAEAKAKAAEEAASAAAAAAVVVVKPPTVNTEEDRVRAARYAVRKKIATEMMTTEQNYLKNTTLVKDLVQKVRQQKIVNEDSLYQVFANTEELVASHSTFFQDLETAVKNWKDESSSVGNIILKHSKAFLPLYRPYIHNYNSSFAAVHYLRKKVVNFQKVISNFEKENSTLDSFLILPVQRIPRYILLMRDMIKYTEERHPDYALLKEASAFLDEGLKSINSTIDNSIMENTTKILDVENMIDGEFETLLQPKRKFIREGRLPLQIVKDKKAKKGPLANAKKSEALPYFALFNDALIYCEPKKDAAQKQTNMRASRAVDSDEKLFDFKAIIPVSEFKKVELLSGSAGGLFKKKIPNGVLVTMDPDYSESFAVFGQTPQEQTLWLNELILALMNHAKGSALKGK